VVERRPRLAAARQDERRERLQLLVERVDVLL
jgi:hypothetical protein